MIKDRFTAAVMAGTVFALLAAAGCSPAVETTSSNGGQAGQTNAAPTNTNGTPPAPTNTGGVPPAPTPAAAGAATPITAAPITAAPTTTPPARTAAESDNAASPSASPRNSNMPRPQIGSGGNDFHVFTQARAALGADAELKNSSIVIDVREGAATLTGTVADAAQKQKAAQLVQGVPGVTSVKNQLRVAAGGSAP